MLLSSVKVSSSETNMKFLSDRVFRPTTTTRHVYDAAALHVVRGAMDGINGN
jgi:centromeric protein E